MRLAPSFQLAVVAAIGAFGAAAIDVVVNGRWSGVMKAAGLVTPAGPGEGWVEAASWLIFLAIGPISCAYFKPLTRRGALALAFGSAAVLSVLMPQPSSLATLAG
jgi:hypothetical protein